MRISPVAGAAFGAAALVLALAGCGAKDEVPPVASAGGAPSAVATADSVNDYVDDVRKYTACLRAEGVSVSDPDAKGKYEFTGDPGQLKRDAKFQAAQTKCSSLLPPMPQGLEDKPNLSAEEIAAEGRYAKCMRDKGVADFPDPQVDGSWPETQDGKPLWDQEAPASAKALAACASIVGAPASPGSGNG